MAATSQKRPNKTEEEDACVVTGSAETRCHLNTSARHRARQSSGRSFGTTEDTRRFTLVMDFGEGAGPMTTCVPAYTPALVTPFSISILAASDGKNDNAQTIFKISKMATVSCSPSL